MLGPFVERGLQILFPAATTRGKRDDDDDDDDDDDEIALSGDHHQSESKTCDIQKANRAVVNLSSPPRLTPESTSGSQSKPKASRLNQNKKEAPLRLRQSCFDPVLVCVLCRHNHNVHACLQKEQDCFV